MKNLFLLFFINLLFFSCKKNAEEVHDFVVVGGGLMGSSTAWQLSKEGQQVLLLEKQDKVYTSGSSFGEARIARSNNRNNDIWSYLHNRSVKEAKELVSFLNTTNQENFSIEEIYTTSPVTYVGSIGIYAKLMASIQRQKVNCKVAATIKEGKELFDVTLPDSLLLQKEYQEHSGTINPKKLINYLHQAVIAKGNEVSYNSRVDKIKLSNGNYILTVVDTKTGTEKKITAKKIVSAAGPYSGKLLKDVAPYFDDLINPQRVYLAFYKIKKEKYDSFSAKEKQTISDAYPVINSSRGGRMGSFFSMIEKTNSDGTPLIKIGGHFQRSAIEDLDKVWEKPITEAEKEWSKDNTLNYFKLFNLPLTSDELEFVEGYSCVYSITKTEVPYVCPIIGESNQPNKNFMVLGGFSGGGAKGSMAYGAIAANIMLEKVESDSMYQVTKQALGFERLLENVNARIK